MLWLAAITSLSVLQPVGLNYPETRTVDVTDTYHGVTVADPYRWLEEPATTPEVRDWINAQNALTNDFLRSIPGRDRLLKELVRRRNFATQSVPIVRANRRFEERNSGLQNQDILFVSRADGKFSRPLIDPNQLSKSKPVALHSWSVSRDGKRLLYGLSEAGSDWVTFRVRDVDTNRDIGEPVRWGKFAAASLNRNATGFFYLRYPEPKAGQAFTSQNLNPAIYFHRIGTGQGQDKRVFSLPQNPDWFIAPGVSEDGNTLFIYIARAGEIGNGVSYVDLTREPWRVETVVAPGGANVTPVHRQGSQFWLMTDADAPRGRVELRDIRRRIAPRTVIAQNRDTLQSVQLVGGRLLLTYMRDAKSALTVHELSGRRVRDVALPGLGTLQGISGEADKSDAYFGYVDFYTPPSVFKLNVRSGRIENSFTPKLAFDPRRFEAKQVFFTSKDGTRVPMFIVHRKGLKYDGTNPTLLYGYGGFNAPQQPWFSSGRSVWMDMGGVWALANIRGGGEYGREWHESATKINKQRSYDDFIAAAEYLIAQRITSPQQLAIQGGSNGGLLIGAVMNQRPELFAATNPQVGVMDMLRFNQFTIGKAWESDYGSPQNPQEFAALLRISPYHNLREGKNYPATLVTTADTDDRVVPAHSFKYAARLQAVSRDNPRPMLIRIQTDAGHGAGTPLNAVLQEAADTYAFFMQAMNRPIPERFAP